MTKELNIEVGISGLIQKIRRNLAIVGKRARRTNGDSMYDDITASEAELPIFADLLMFGAETIVSELAELASGYVEENEDTIKFDLYSDRWCFEGTPDMDVTKALEGMISNYLYNFCLARYLSEIHPSTGEKYPPLFGRTYQDHCDLLMRNIKSLAFIKRNKETPKDSEGEISYGSLSVNENVEDDSEN